MGDLLRRLLYPLLLPAIVVTVWVHAWATKQEPGQVQMVPSLPTAAEPIHPAPAFPARASGYGFSSPDDAYAGIDFSDDAPR